MASQTPNASAGQPVKKGSKEPKRGIKNPFVYIGTIIILIITVIAFVFIPSVGGGSASGQGLNFGSYAGQTITYAQGNYFAKQVSAVNDALRQQGLTEQNYQLYAYQVWRQAFERTVTHLAIIDAVKSAGGGVSDAFLDDRMAADQSFQENGKFSPKIYRDASLSEKLALRDSLKDDAYTQLFVEDVYSLTPSSAEVAFVKDMAKTTRSIDYASFQLSAYPDTEVQSWLSSNLSTFRRLKLSRIVVSTSEADALKIQKQVKSGSLAFEEAAKKHSSDSFADKGGSMGTHYFYEIASDFEGKDSAEKIASLKKGEISPVFKTVTGSWVIYRADEDLMAADPADPTLLADARTYMMSSERGKVEDWAIAQAKTFASGATGDFGKACKKAGLELKSTGPFPINYGDLTFSAYGQTIPLFSRMDATGDLSSASTNEAFISAVFAAAPGSVSQPIVLGDKVLVFKAKESAPASDAETAGLSLYYPYFYQQNVSSEIGGLFLKSPKLRDNFMKVFYKTFQSKQS
jgi:peptidyl-prolyl cis-trans isomerase D